MKKSLSVPLILLGAIPMSALAQTLPPIALTPIVPTGKPRQVGFFSYVNPDCSTTGDIDARITKQPENGTVELEHGLGFTNFKEQTQRYPCNMKPVQGIKVHYTSKEGFIGKDTFEVEFLYNPGGDIIWKYAVTVK